MGWDLVEQNVDNAVALVWDGCHKIYLAMDDEQVKVFRSHGYGEDASVLYVTAGWDHEKRMEVLREWYENSCGLRFIEMVHTGSTEWVPGFTSMIPQFMEHSQAVQLEAKLQMESTKTAATLAHIAALMGSHESWPGADMLEWIEDELRTSGLFEHEVADQSPEALTYWRGIAESYGFEHDG